MLQNNPDKKDRNRDFEAYGLKGIKTGYSEKAEQRCLCPECEDTRTHKGHKDCQVNVDYGVWHCHHCGATGYVPTRTEVEKRTNKERRIERLRSMAPDQKKYSRPKWVPEFVVGNLLNPHKDQQEIITYLTETRKISKEVLTRAKVSIPWVEQWMNDPSGAKDAEGKPLRIKKTTCAISFNYFDRGVLINQKSRLLNKTFWFHKGAELIPYNINAILRKEVCYITEGEFDALSLMEAGLPEAISVPAGGSNTNLTWLDRFVETHFMDKKVIYLALDLDPVGLNMMKELIRRLGSSKCRVVIWDDGCKDANEELCKYGVEGIRRCIDAAVEVPMYGIQTAHTPEVERELDDMFMNGQGHGAAVSLPGFDQQVTFETGRYMVVTGRPGDGKSEFVDELCLRLCLLHEWRVAYFSPENVPLKYHLAKLVSKLTGYEFKQGGRMTMQLYNGCKDWLDQNVCHIMPGSEADDELVFFNDGVPGGHYSEQSERSVTGGSALGNNEANQNLPGGQYLAIQEALRPNTADPESFTLDEVLAVAREAVQRRGVRICVFDPLNSFRRGPEQAGMSDLQWYLHVCNTMLGFAHRNDVLVILVAHPRKVDRSMLDNRKRRVEMNDISGSSDFGNKCDFCLSVDRDDDLQVVTVYVDKVKFKHLGTRGQVHLHYDILTGRYVPCTIQKLSEQDFIMQQGQSRKSGEQLITIGNNHYLKSTDWRNFNIRWIDEDSHPILGQQLSAYINALNNSGQYGLF